MKIVILVSRFPPKWLAGTEIATYDLAKHLAQRGHEVHVITSHDYGFPSLSEEGGFYIHRIARPEIRFIGALTFWGDIYFKIRDINPDIIHAQTLSLGIPALISNRLLRIQYIIWGQGSDIYLPNWLNRLTAKMCLKNAGAAIALTDHMKKAMQMMCERNIDIIPNGIELERYEGKNEERSMTGNRILFVGRLHPIKGINYLLEAICIVHQELPEAKLIIVGDGIERETLENLTDDLGISEYVEFVGNVPHEQVTDLMLRADVFALPSLSEGFPLVILEAMACGLPIIATRVGGVPEVVEGGVNGCLVNAKSPYEIADKISMLLKNDKIRLDMSNNNRERVKMFSWNKVTNAVEEVYRKVTSEHDGQIE